MAFELELESHDVGGQDPQRLLEQLLARLVALEDGDPKRHAAVRLAISR